MQQENKERTTRVPPAARGASETRLPLSLRPLHHLSPTSNLVARPSGRNVKLRIYPAPCEL